MSQNHRRRSTLNCGDKHLAWGDQESVEGSLANVPDREQPSASVQEQNLKMLDRVGPIVLSEQVRNLLGSVDERRVLIALLRQSLSENEGTANGLSSTHADAWDTAKFIKGSLCEIREGSELCD